MSFNIEVQGGKSYLLPTGGKYCPQDIAIAAIGGQTEGMYCWAKGTLVKGEEELSFPTNNSITLIPSASGYEIKSGSGNANWNLYYLNSGLIDTADHKVKIDYTIGAGLGHNILIGFADTTPVSIYSNLDYSFFSGTDKKINNWQNGSNKGTYSSLSTGDKVTVEVYGGAMSVYKNGTLEFTSTMTFTAGYACIVLYSANTTYGTINATMDNVDLFSAIGYVLSEELNAYPQDGYHTDGFYYKLLENDIPWDERGRYAWAQYDTPPYEVPMDKVATKNMTISKGGRGYVIKSTSGSSGWGVNRLDMPLVKKVVFYPKDTSLYMQIGVMKDSNTINQGQANFGMAFYTDGGAIKHHRNGAYVASYGTFTLSDVFTIEFTDTEMRVYKNGAFLFSDNTFNSTYTKLSFECYQGSATIGEFEFGEKVDPIGYTASNDESAYPNDGIASDGYYYTKVGATKVSPKYASGTTTSVNNKISVSGLAFRPYAVAVRYSTNSFSGFVFCDSDGNVAVDRIMYSNTVYPTSPVFVNDGFALTSTQFGNGVANINWYALGY